MKFHEGIIKNTEFFTTAELAKKLKMNAQVITRKIQSGEIRAYKIGKDWRIPEQEVYNWLETHANDSNKKTKTLPVIIKDVKIKKLPVQPGKRKYLLEYILAQFEPNKDYTEREVKSIISRFHHDTAAVRDEFVVEKMMDIVEGNYRRRAGYRLSS